MTTIETSTGGRSAGEVLAWSRDMVEATLRPAADTLPASMRRIAGYHFGWWDEKGRPSATGGGKAIRPALALLSAEAVGAPPSRRSGRRRPSSWCTTSPSCTTT